MYVCVCVCVHACVCMCACVCACVRVCVYVGRPVRMLVDAGVCMYIFTHIHMCVCAYIHNTHTHIHTYTIHMCAYACLHKQSKGVCRELGRVVWAKGVRRGRGGGCREGGRQVDDGCEDMRVYTYQQFQSYFAHNFRAHAYMHL